MTTMVARLSTHISLVDATDQADGWRDMDAALRTIPLHESDDCTRCAQARAYQQQALTLIDRADAYLVPEIRTLQHAMLDLQREVRAYTAEIMRAVQGLRDLTHEHFACANCSILAGPGHHVSTLVREPGGFALVCDDCYDVLQRTATVLQAKPTGGKHGHATTGESAPERTHGV